VGAENLNPLDELKSLDQQVDLATDLAALKPIFYRLDEIAKQYSSDFEVQLVVGDIKQHLVTRGTRLREQRHAAPAPPASTPPPVKPVASTPPPLPPLPEGELPTLEQTLPAIPTPPPIAAPPPAPPEPPKTAQAPPSKPPAPPPPPRQRPQASAKSALNWKRAVMLGVLAGAVASVVLIGFLVNQARRHARALTAPVEVSIATTPPGASVRVAAGQDAAETACTSDCKVSLAPGTYQVTAFLDGYQPSASSVTVAAGKPASVSLSFMPQAQTVRILTDLDQGKVTFDDQPAADLQEGQFVLEDVPAGAHTVKVTGRDSDASFSFEIANAMPPAITGTISARNLAATAVSSLGAKARVFTSAGPMKLALNGEAQADAGPGGVDLTNFQPGVDEIVVGEGKDQHNMKESFGPAPMLTVFLKSDVNAGTLIVSTGEDDVKVFVNGKEYRRKTRRGQVRIQTLGPASVRVSKDGFMEEPVQTAEVKKGDEIRLEFKLRPTPKVAVLQLRGATPGAEVLVDQKSVGAVGADGNFSYNAVQPGDRLVEIRREQYSPKRIQRPFRAGQTVVLSGADVVLAVANGIVKFTRTPPTAAVSYRRADENTAHEASGNQVELPAGGYIFTAKAPGYADKVERFQLSGGETRALELTLARELPPAPPPVTTAGMSEFDSSAWKKDGDAFVNTGSGVIPYKLPAKGIFTFNVELRKGGGLFRGGRIRWVVQYLEPKNYLLFELDRKNFWAEVVENGKKLEREKTELDLDDSKSYSIQIEILPDRLVHKLLKGNEWVVLDSFSEPGRNFTKGKFGFLIQGNDEIAISDFKFTPK
jgi:PEGA domain